MRSGVRAVALLAVLTATCGEPDASPTDGRRGVGRVPGGYLEGPEGGPLWMVGSHFYVHAGGNPAGFFVVSTDPSVLAVEDTDESRAPSICDREGLCPFRRRIEAVGAGDAYLELRHPNGTVVDDVFLGVRLPDRMVITSRPDNDTELSMPDDDVWLVDSTEALRLRAIVYAGTYALSGQPPLRASLDGSPTCVLTDDRDYDFTVAALAVGDHRLQIDLQRDTPFERIVTLRAVAAGDVVRMLSTDTIGVDSRSSAGSPAVRAVALTAELEIVHGVRDITWTSEVMLGVGTTLFSNANGGEMPRNVLLEYVRGDGTAVSHMFALPLGLDPEIRDPPRPTPTCAALTSQ